ncbi:MAG: UDP-N-acetylmuramoyl-L-alanyl-D-glutamate--2,6-diaminopimelate ligase [Ruminococcaceae bacterium]|nr:UDP-N-acetylmuramoyl-L-alanyl-D-glutamate--2,6-diaminopimelate ligase [Oscillospiraceae bacterium]
MELCRLLKSINAECQSKKEITKLCNNSKLADENSVFVCIKGFSADGHKYALSAYEKGCRVFVASDKLSLPEDAEVFYCEDTRKAMALLAAEINGNPAKKLTLIGITGTKGKTSISYTLKSILEKQGKKVGLMGTVGILYGDTLIESPNSTPESTVIHEYLKKMLDCGIDTVIMEATSQGFKLHRTYGITFDVGIYTNLSPDHIGPNEHESFEEYKECKKMLFSQSKVIFANGDCEHLSYMKENCSVPVYTFGFGDTDNKAENETYSKDEKGLFTAFTCGSQEYKTYIPGKFSIYNALAAIVTARHLGISEDAIKLGLEATLVEGRMESIPLPTGAVAIIDYAHNELSTENLFEALKLYKPSRIITVFGCGGNRSKLRRYGMGEIIAKNSQLSIVTSDNPRDESLDDIIADIYVGINKAEGKSIVIKDRKKAIEYAVKNSKAGDYILVIGKGHQHYEEIKGVHYPFFEAEIIKNAISQK